MHSESETSQTVQLRLDDAAPEEQPAQLDTLPGDTWEDVFPQPAETDGEDSPGG